MSKHTIVKGTALSAWASYLINNDASGLDPQEREQADKFAEWLGARPCDCEDAGFMRNHDAMFICGALAGDCQTYTALVQS